MKKILYIAVLLTGLSAQAAPTPPEVSEKVLKAFQETFANARDVNWKELDHSYEANFKMQEIQVRASYDADGNLVETLRYYGENNLPPNILAKLKKKYNGKEIYGVTELTTETEVSYNIILRDEKNWYTVKSDPYATLQLVDKFKRSENDR